MLGTTGVGRKAMHYVSISDSFESNIVSTWSDITGRKLSEDLKQKSRMKDASQLLFKQLFQLRF